MSLLDVTTMHGDVSYKKYFMQQHGQIPSRFEIYLNQKQKLDIDKLFTCYEEFFPGAKIIRSITINENKTSEQEEDDLLDIRKNRESSILIDDYKNKEIWSISTSNITILHLDKTIEQINEIRSKFPIQEEESYQRQVHLVALDGSYYYTIKSEIKEVNVDLKENYNDDFLEVNEKMINFINEKSTGLALWYGGKGTGKTTAIRNLMASVNKKFLLITNAVAAHIAEPEFISFLLSNRNSIFILEDCEQILMERENNLFGGAIANILNMSDGLLSDIFNIKFICTFNTSIDKIDKALLRKGRCKVNYEFKPLCKEKVKALNDKYNLGIKDIQDMTLADIYNYTPEEVKKKPKKIGF